MPSWRKLHLKTTESIDVNELPDDFTRLLWVLLPLGLDSEGRGLDNPSWVRAKLMPLRTDVSLDQIAAAFDCFGAHGMILRYEVSGRRYFAIPTWHKYQGDTSRESGSTFPPPPAPDVSLGRGEGAPPDAQEQPPPDPPVTSSRPTQELLATNSRPTHDLLLTHSRPDSDSDSELDADADSDSDSAAPPEAVAPSKTSSERDDPHLLILYQKSYDLPRLTTAQETTLRGLAAQYGRQRLAEVIAWAAGAGIPQARALRAIRTALPGWQAPARRPSYPAGSAPQPEPIDELIAELQQNPKEANRGHPRRNTDYP
jgi:hypothetical protein